MRNIGEKNRFVLGLDISTKTIGVALFEDLGDKGVLKLLHHVTPIVKPKPQNKLQELFEKAKIFEEEFLTKYSDINIYKVIIEEPLLRSNNVNTVSTLLRFNGMVSRSVYDILGVIPEYISSYDSRKYAYPELMEIRLKNKKGIPYSEKELSRSKPVLFGGYDLEVDKKMVVWEKVSEIEPQIVWLYDKKQKLKKENFDMCDAYSSVIGKQRMDGYWL
jgi:hypothetical protein